MPETQSATVGASPGEMRSQRDARRDPPESVLALYAAFLSDPSGSFQFKLEPGLGDKPRWEKVHAAFLEEQRAFFHRLKARTLAIARGQPDSPLPPAVGQFHCQSCGAEYEFDRRGMLRAALAARGEPYGTEPMVGPLCDALDVVVAALAEELPNSANKLTLERSSDLYKLKLEHDGFGQVIASAPDGLAAEDEPTARKPIPESSDG